MGDQDFGPLLPDTFGIVVGVLLIALPLLFALLAGIVIGRSHLRWSLRRAVESPRLHAEPDGYVGGPRH